MTWFSVRVWPEAATRDAVTQVLFDHGCAALQDDGPSIVTCFPEEQIAAIRAAMTPDVRVEITPIADVDWSERWKDQLRAHRIGSLTIAPPWLATPGAIVIEPAMAFGTGDHPTTRGVLHLMQQVIRRGDLVADLGAGSAILSIAAAKLGASRVAAIEIDAEAIRNAELNVRQNDVDECVRVIQGDAIMLLPLLAPVRVVLANIISSVIVELLPTIDASLTADGAMIVSGVLRAERAHMLSVFESAGWLLTDETAEEELGEAEIGPTDQSSSAVAASTRRGAAWWSASLGRAP